MANVTLVALSWTREHERSTADGALVAARSQRQSGCFQLTWKQKEWRFPPAYWTTSAGNYNWTLYLHFHRYHRGLDVISIIINCDMLWKVKVKKRGLPATYGAFLVVFRSAAVEPCCCWFLHDAVILKHLTQHELIKLSL